MTRFKVRIFLVGIWMVFTVSLAAWWMIFGLQQVESLREMVAAAGSSDVAEQFFRQHKMLIWEGAILLISLLVGGVSLFYLVLQTQAQSRKLKEFFATFSHDLKTSLTSLRLQAEALQEDFRDRKNPLLDRLLNDTVRLQVQLENSLFLADLDRRRLFIEKLDLGRLIDSLRAYWPEAEILLKRGGYVRADARAFESVLKNLIQNSISHGEAGGISVDVKDAGSGRVELRIDDDGKGFQGDYRKLGELFTRHTPRSGSGVGLYLVCNLLKGMDGKVKFEKTDKGFAAVIHMPGAVK